MDSNLGLIVLAIACGSIGTLLLISRISGWASLAERYQYSDLFDGKRWWFQSAQMRWLMGYNNCLIVGANRKGLYLGVIWPFRIGHPPLLIPWNDIAISTKRLLGFRSMDLRFRYSPAVPFRISERLGRKLAEVAGPSWPGLIQ